MLTLDRTRIDVWLVRPEEVQSPALLAGYRQLLTPAERVGVDRFRFHKDRHRALITRALVRTTLSRYCPIAPQEWIFAANEHGRPHVANAPTALTDLSFNISHTTGLIALAVGYGRVVGVDTEYLERKNATADIAHRFFAPTEVAELAALPEAEQRERFFQYWTLKESYIKARGMGLALPLDGFAFELSKQGVVDFTVDPKLADVPTRWHFWLFRESPQHFLALCCERRDVAPKVIIHDVVPLVSEAEVTYPTVRQTLSTFHST